MSPAPGQRRAMREGQACLIVVAGLSSGEPSPGARARSPTAVHDAMRRHGRYSLTASTSSSAIQSSVDLARIVVLRTWWRGVPRACAGRCPLAAHRARASCRGISWMSMFSTCSSYRLTFAGAAPKLFARHARTSAHMSGTRSAAISCEAAGEPVGVTRDHRAAPSSAGPGCRRTFGRSPASVW